MYADSGPVVGQQPREKPQSPLWEGAQHETANAGEMTALLRAVRHAQEQPLHRVCAFHVDSIMAIRVARGKRQRSKKGQRAGQPGSNEATASGEADDADPHGLESLSHKVLRTRLKAAMATLVRQRGIRRVRLYKVKGHSGDVWNDYADSWAAHGRDGQNEDAALELLAAMTNTAAAEAAERRLAGQAVDGQSRGGEAGVT